MPDSTCSFGLNVARYRTSRSISQMELGLRTGTDKNTIQRIESGKGTNTDKVPALCGALDVSPNQLFGHGSDPFAGLEPELADALKKVAESGKKESPEKQRLLADVLLAQAALMK